MDGDYPFPHISAQNYEAFRRLLGDELPATYQEWLDFLRKRTFEETSRGQNVLKVPIDPDEFVRFCNSTGERYSNAALGRFAIEKVGGKNY
jgi:hypothetical protein